MQVMCVGVHKQSIDLVQLAIRLRWPGAVFVTLPPDGDRLRDAETSAIDLAVVIGRGCSSGTTYLCSQLRAFSEVPILAIGDGTVDSFDSVRALNAGADQYIGPTASLVQIVARAVAIVRRARAYTLAANHVLRSGDLSLNPGTCQVLLGHRDLNLTAKEFEVLHLLMRNRGVVVRHSVLERALWGDEVDSSLLVKKYIHRLRRKLADVSGTGHEYIRSIHGVGYLFAGSREAEARGYDHQLIPAAVAV